MTNMMHLGRETAPDSFETLKAYAYDVMKKWQLYSMSKVKVESLIHHLNGLDRAYYSSACKTESTQEPR